MGMYLSGSAIAKPQQSSDPYEENVIGRNGGEADSQGIITNNDVNDFYIFVYDEDE